MRQGLAAGAGGAKWSVHVTRDLSAAFVARACGCSPADHQHHISLPRPVPVLHALSALYHFHRLVMPFIHLFRNCILRI